ncbi:hypothetical protein SADUNF_Sadunf13G0120300 [Salix dunnii]|uniref:peroxidase n=1 Tax=Salix dunnii TaxID=1413687 RepID=A0A835JM32_9ROSI|nr:hypothetical protein SADUNF_Sadunf13G0120300 [Salix dunnii]
MGASLLRLYFHDCFVNDCDGSVLLDDTANFTGEKTTFPNLNSLRGFEVVDQIKSAVNQACSANVVSYADILAVAARDSVNLSHGLNLTDLVVLSAGHTIGLARCSTFRDRIYNDTNINYKFATSFKYNCPITGGDSNTNPLDLTTARFDSQYFRDLIAKKGLLHSDQKLFKGNGSGSDPLVKYYGYINPYKSLTDFSASMIKMGNMKRLTGNDGEIRMNCRKVNN